MANFVYNMYMHLIQTTHHYHQTLLQLPPAMVEESEEVQSQETEMETEEEGMPTQADIPCLTDAGVSHELLASQTEATPGEMEATPGQAGTDSNPEATSTVSEVTAAAAGPEAVPTEAGTQQDATSAPETN